VRGLTVSTDTPARPAVVSGDLVSNRASRPIGVFVIVVLSYVLLAMMANLTAWLHGPSHMIQAGGAGDLSQAAWFLGFSPYALLHGQNPLFTTFMNFPWGVNLVVNTGMLFPAVLFAPVTFLFGPVATFNVIFAAGIAGSATAFFFVSRCWVSWLPAAYIGGLLYGFSPYMAAQGQAHLDWVIAVSPPLFLYLLREILIVQRWRAWSWGIMLGLLAAAQFYTSSEMLADIFVESVFAGALLAIFGRHHLRGRLSHAVKALAIAALTLLVVTAYPVWLVFRGPQHLVGPAPASTGFLVSDLAGLIFPTRNQRFDPAPIAHYSAGFVGGALQENGTYLGVTLLIVLVVMSVALWRAPIIRFAIAMLVVSLILSFGDRLVIDGHITTIRLPFDVAPLLPLFNSAIPVRFALFVDLFGALVLAVGLDRLRDGGSRRWLVSGWQSISAAILVAVFALVPLVPRWPYAISDTQVAAFFRSPAVKLIPQNSVVLTYPFPRAANSWPMLWQVEDGLRFKLPGGYVITPASNGTGTFNGVPSTTETLLTDCLTGSLTTPLTPAVIDDIRSDLRTWDIDTGVITDPPDAPGTQGCATELMTAALNEQPRLIDGAAVWTHIISLATR
jgi:hypothetical protein